MNRLTIIGNLVKNPELRTTQSKISVCSFTVAVNKRHPAEGGPDADYFKVTAWRERGELCAKFLQKGKKVCVIGPVSVSVFTGNDGTTRAQMEVTADEVEFLSPRVSDGPVPEEPKDVPAGFQAVETDELPF